MSSRRIQQILAASSLLVLSQFSLGQTEGTWATDVGTAGGSWSVGTNWQGGIVPNGGGTANFVAVPFSTAPLLIFQDLPSLTLNQVNFLTQITYRFNATGTNSLTLTGDAVLNAPIPSINTQSITSFGQLIQMPISGSAGLTKRGPGTVTLWQNANTYTGTTKVEDGVLVLRQIGDTGLGNAANGVTFDGGTIRVTTTAWASNRAITLDAGGGTIDATNTGTTTFNGVVNGSGVLNKIGGRGLTLTANNGYTGATNVLAGSIGLSSAGAIPSTSALTVRDALLIDNVLVNSTDRINDAAPVTLQGAAVTFNGHLAGASSENFGTTNFSRGTTTITLAPSPGQGATLALGSVERELGGTAFFRGTNLGTSSGTFSNVTFGSAPTLVGGGGADGTTNISIIPWAYGNTNAAAAANAATNSFVTYGANGVRPLDIATEYTSSILGAGSTENVRFTGASAIGGAQTINSLILTGTGPLAGAGTLTVTSGALLNTGNGFAMDLNLNFGSAEAMIIAPASINFNGVISGSGGLTKQGAGVATFAAANTYTGTTVIGAGTAAYTSSVASGAPSAFGNSTSPVQLAPAGLGTGGTTARLVYSGSAPASFDRDLNVSGRISVGNAATLPGFGVTTATTLTMNGDITLDATPMTFIGTTGSTLVVNGDITGDGGPITDQSTGAGTIRLNGNNTFADGVEMSAATWQVGSDSAFGNGGLLKMVQTSTQPTIQAVGGPRIVSNPAVSFSNNVNYWTIGGSEDITFTGSINLSGSYTHNINNTALTTYAGGLHTGGFTKAGPGVLVLSGDNVYTGVTTISAGTLRVTHSNALGSPLAPTVVASGAALQLRDGALTSEPVTLNGAGIAAGGALVNLAGVNSVGNVALASGSRIVVQAGSLTTGNIDATAGTPSLTVLGGPVTANRVRAGDLTLDGAFSIAPGRSTSKTSRISSLTVTATTKLDLGDNDLVVDYTGATPAGNIRTFLTNGYAGGSWNGNGIASSVAATTAGTALGYAEAADVFTTFPATFSGQTVDNTAVLIRYTRYGDANLDGTTDIGDFALLGANFNATGSAWVRGDFNYDGATDIGDFALLAANFNQSAPASSPRASVPEPSALTALLLGAAGLLRRVRR